MLTMTNPIRRASVLFSLAALAFAVGCAPTEESTSDSDPAQTTSSLADCTPEQLDPYKDGTLTVGTDDPAFEPWFKGDDPTNGKGYESAVAYAIADRLGFSDEEVTWTKVPFNTSYQPGKKDFDFDINQISITKARAKAVTFSNPYYSAAQAVVALEGSDFAGATSLAELKDAKIGAQVGTTSLEAIDQIDPAANPSVYDDTTAATKALENGQVDALIADLPSAYYITAAVIDGGTIVGQFQPQTGESEQFGLLFSKGNPLVSCVNAAIDSLEEDGTLADLEEKWLSQTTGVPELS